MPLKKTSLLGALAIGLFGTLSHAQTVDLMPGRWSVNHTVQVPAQGFTHNESQSFCLTPQTASLTFDQILRSLNFAQCTSRNEIITQGTGRADITCVYPEYGNVTANGKIEATYTDTAYRIEATMTGRGVGVVDAQYVGVGTHKGACN